MGLSENSVPPNPMVNDHYPYQMAIIGGIPHFQTYPYVQKRHPQEVSCIISAKKHPFRLGETQRRGQLQNSLPVA